MVKSVNGFSPQKSTKALFDSTSWPRGRSRPRLVPLIPCQPKLIPALQLPINSTLFNHLRRDRQMFFVTPLYSRPKVRFNTPQERTA